jgi:hypothetical protein
VKIHRDTVVISSDRRLSVQLPDDFPVGPAKVFLFAGTPDELNQLDDFYGWLEKQPSPVQLEDEVDAFLQRMGSVSTNFPTSGNEQISILIMPVETQNHPLS